MKLELQIKNFGKIQDATIKLRPFTLIAGANSCGKSFVTKSLYSFFNTMNKDHLGLAVIRVIQLCQSGLNYIEDQVKLDTFSLSSELTALKTSYQVFEAFVIAQFISKTTSEQLMVFPSCAFHANQITIQINLFTTALKELALPNETVTGIINILSMVVKFLTELMVVLQSPSTLFADDFAEGIKDNFQVQSLSELHNYHAEDDQAISFDFKDTGKISINDNAVDFNFDLSNPTTNHFNDINNVVLLESPIYWKIKNALEFTRKEKAKIGLGKRTKSQVLTGIPQHFYDLVDLLDTRVKIDPNEANDKSIYDAIHQQIGGEIEVSDAGDIYFKEQGSPRNISINSTASGITNIGLIALLLKRHVIAKGSYLFIDEPEVNLHPLWQKVMVETLYKLSRSGINVVIASHSIDMMKALENIMDGLAHDDIEQHFAVNQLTTEGRSVNEESPVTKKLAAIKSDLGKPFYDMFLENDWE